MLLLAMLLSIGCYLLCSALVAQLQTHSRSAFQGAWGLQNSKSARILLVACLALPLVVLWQSLIGLGPTLALLLTVACLSWGLPSLARYLSSLYRQSY